MSTIVSIVAVSFAAATLCFDVDLDPDKRAKSPDFYGYVPNSSGRRTIVFLAMFLFTLCHVSMRLLGVALLVVTSKTVARAVLGGEIVFFLLFKFVRGDLRRPEPLEGILSWVISIVLGSVFKILCDYSAIVQFRKSNPQKPAINEHTPTAPRLTQ